MLPTAVEPVHVGMQCKIADYSALDLEQQTLIALWLK